MKIVIIEPLGVDEEIALKEATKALGEGVEIVYYDTRVTDTKTLIERGKDAEVVIVSNLPMNRQVIEGCKKLKMLSVAFTGIDHIAMDACRERGITVSNCSGYSNCAVADLVFGMIFAIYRNLIACNRIVREEGTKEGLIGYELEGKKFGVIGTGAIGQRVINIAKVFGCQVYTYSRTPKQIQGVKNVSKEELLKTCDIVSLHLPLNEETKHMIGKKELQLMKEEAILINTARGSIVNSEDLADALKKGKIAGAGVDVFEMEPPIPSNHPLFGVPNLFATPHVAFATKEALEKRAAIVFDNVKQWIKGKPVNVM